MKFEKRVEWSHEKNLLLRKERGLSFEAVVIAIENEHLLDILPHANQKYEHQKIYVVEMNEQIVLVPFVEDEEKIFLKTAFPSRKAAKQYQRGKQ